MQGRIRSVRRFLDFAFSTTIGLVGFFWAILWGKPKETAGLKFRRNWLNSVPKRLGLRIKLEGEPFRGPCLYVANHISYIDPICILMQTDAKIVAKAEISNWPMVGYSASITGTIFVHRDVKTSRSNAASAVRKALFEKESILVFPEGTTSAGPLTLPFRPRTFEAAKDAGVPVQPIAVYYEDPSVAFIGEDMFIPHFTRLSRMKTIHGTIAFGPPLYGEDACERAKEWIDQKQSVYLTALPAHAFA